MLNLAAIRKDQQTILAIGSHKANVQAILDFDYLCGKTRPSIVGIVTSAGKYQKYHWGNTEVLVPCFSSFANAHTSTDLPVKWMFNMHSGRRAYESTKQFFEEFPNANGGHIFAEDVPELHAIRLREHFSKKTIIGPAGVGMIVPGHLKLGVIGGIDWRQISGNNLMSEGDVAVLSASGGMINEIITMTAQAGHQISFAVCFGGERFPIVSPSDAFLAAEKDTKTKHIIYYGELGGYDEYEVAKLIASRKISKPVICYIAGAIGESFNQPVQFGHAKALANNKRETATAKRRILAEAGAQVATSMLEFITLIKDIPREHYPTVEQKDLSKRRSSLFTSSISAEKNGTYHFVGKSLREWAEKETIQSQVTAALLGREPRSAVTVKFIEKVFLLSVDHGPQVSGAVATNIAARAGKSLVDSLAAGLLTIGPRFGGAVTDAAREWFDGVREGREPIKYVEEMAREKKYIGGIGHKKYRLGMPDPRIAILSAFADDLPSHPHYDYARKIESITSAKKGSLILNVDGAIAAIMLDILQSHEGFRQDELDELISADFFNALFVIPRTVGFIGHYLDQKRMDEGLFRLSDEDMLLLG